MGKYNTIMILGANSDISKELVLILNQEKRINKTILISRDILKLQDILKEKINLDDSYEFKSLNLENDDEIKSYLSDIKNFPDLIISFIGELDTEQDAVKNIKRTININYLLPSKFIELVGEQLILRKMKNSKIVGISSVAGQKGRKINYHYGASKSALSTFLSGLRQKLATENISVLTIELGFVKTKMTKNIPFPSFLTDNAHETAKKILRAVYSSKEIYVPIKWKIIMFLIKLIPEKIFKKLNF